MRIIPAIDLIDGKCVRLSQGDYSKKKIYNENPLEIAKRFEDAGIEFLHLVDLDGAKANHIVNYRILETLCTKTNLKIDFGGGVKSKEDVDLAFKLGANQVTAGSIAINQQMIFLNWLEEYGPDKIVLGADAVNRKIASYGWLNKSTTDVLSFIEGYEKKGVKYVICTDISKDGMLMGPALDLYREIIQKTDVKLIASGGVSSVNDLVRLKQIGCDGAIVGKAIYEGKINLNELKSLC